MGDGTLSRIAVLAALLAGVVTAPAFAAPKPQIMIVGTAHFVSKADVHNADFMDPFSPTMQAQIEQVVQRLSAFKPTKVLLECAPSDTRCVDQYVKYRQGTYALTGTEIDQIGYRIAARAKLPTVYGVDYREGLDFNALLASAKKNGQPYMDEAEAHVKSCGLDQMTALQRRGALLELMQLLNSQPALDCNASWYMYADRVGADSDYSGAEFAAHWYSRNLHMLANIMRHSEPGDRVLVLIGQGHAALLDPFVKLAPYADFVDPLVYLR
jgi:hypothetical protein